MKTIFKVISKYSLSIFIIIVLLAVQAYCDLLLPEYTSNIINVGIQQKGIEDNVLDIMSSNTFEVLNYLTDEDLGNYYELKENYEIKKINEEERNKLSNILLKPEVIYSMFNAGREESATINEINFIMNTDGGKMLINSYDDMDPTLASQFGISFVSDEYDRVGKDTESLQMNYLFRTGTRMILLSLFIMADIIFSVYLSGKVAALIAYDLRSLVVNRVMSYSSAEYNAFSTSSLITRSTNDINQVSNFITMLLRMILYAPIVGCGAVVKIIHIDMAWIIAVGIGLILMLVIILMIVAMPKFKIIQKLIDRVNQIVREVLNGLPVIRAFANEDFEKKKFKKANQDLFDVNLFTHKVMALMEPCMSLIMNGLVILIYWIGASNIDAGTLQIGTLTALITYSMHIVISFLMLSLLSIMAPRAIISTVRIGEVLNMESSIKEKDNIKHFDANRHGEIEFKNVSFKYPDGDSLVLSDISFKANKGEVIAIIGATGCGKSSLINLIPRFHDVTEGSIIIDGEDIRDVSLTALRNRIGVVPQKGLLFSGTLAENIKFAGNVSDEEMVKAAEVSCSSEFIDKLPDNYNYLISQGGTNVSGGQRQRLSIARAVAKKPEIIIFDDSFSALDYKTDKQVRSNLNKYLKDSTKIIVAQRVGTVMNADQIIVLDEGKIVGIGKHKDLYQNCPVYKEIALSQLKEEELV